MLLVNALTLWQTPSKMTSLSMLVADTRPTRENCGLVHKVTSGHFPFARKNISDRMILAHANLILPMAGYGGGSVSHSQKSTLGVPFIIQCEL